MLKCDVKIIEILEKFYMIFDQSLFLLPFHPFLLHLRPFETSIGQKFIIFGLSLLKGNLKVKNTHFENSILRISFTIILFVLAQSK